MANANVAGLSGSWAQGCIAGIVGASVGPIGGVAQTPPPPPPEDEFLLKMVNTPQAIPMGGSFVDITDLSYAIAELAIGRYKADVMLEVKADTNNLDDCIMKIDGPIVIGESSGVWRMYPNGNFVASTDGFSGQPESNATLGPLPAAGQRLFFIWTGFIELINITQRTAVQIISTNDDITIEENSYFRVELENA